jgi:AraC-like DNA-binding protein
MPYHTLTRSLESAAYAPLKAREVFSNAVGHVLNGLVDMDRHHRAGRLAGERLLSESTMAEIVADQLRLDMNPFMQCMLRARTRAGALLVHQGLNQLLAVKTEVGFGGDGVLAILSRTSLPSGEDPVACRDVHLMGMDIVLTSINEISAADCRSGTSSLVAAVRPPDRLSELAQMLGLGSGVACDAAFAFECEPELRVDALARHLGCHHRTLQREFRLYGITAEMIKRASMLSQATILLTSKLTLTEIAYEAGYSDHAHMTRAFVSSCSLAPSILRHAFAPPPSLL